MRPTLTPRRRTIAALVTTALLAGAAAAQPANAATYTVWACANGSGAPLGPGDWQPNREDPFSDVSTTCGAGSTPAGSLAALSAAAKSWLGGPNYGEGTGWTLNAPSSLRLTGLSLWWAYQVNPVAIPPFGRIQIYAGPDSAFIADSDSHGAFAGASPSVGFSAQNLQTFDNLNVNALTVEAWCLNRCTDVASQIAAKYELYRAKAIVSDSVAPQGSAVGLSDGARIATPTAIAVHATDDGGGVRALALQVDGQTVDSTGGGGTCDDVDTTNDDPLEYVAVQPCPAARDATLTLAPERLPDAEPHTVTIVATDAAGQQTVLASAHVARAAPAGSYDAQFGFINPDLTPATTAINGAGGGPAKLRVSFPVTRKAKHSKRKITRYVTHRTVAYHGQPLVQAHLTSLTNTPIASARVWLASAERGLQWTLSGPYVTDARGIAKIRLPRDGASRRLRVLYWPLTSSNGHGESNSLSLRVKAPVRLARSRAIVAPRGRVTFTARLPRDAFTSRQAVTGTLQVLQRGHWSTVRAVRISASTGRWTTRLRFDRSPVGARFKFRVRVGTQAPLRYSASSSPVRAITIARGGRHG